ncbi:hypothetical protein [uncultured Massilia sp.]|uniref:hypothetical protein n=1 Tax=uncultured Massilia sp. TaxID=169973 RepID=UPI0025D3C240|nr:hypothetical protein [uncultured Massilia sp.]
MNVDLLRTLALTEARQRLRRLSTLVVLLAVVALGWLMIPDPRGGSTLIAVAGARVVYTSSALALGSASLAALVFGLAGFFLLRGRMAEDLRAGLGGVIGASPAGNALFLAARWCGGVLYLLALMGVFLLTILACHLLRGEGPIEPLVYLQTHALVLVPLALYCASCAVLCDSWAPLMGKGGDLLFFLGWVAQLGMLAETTAGAAAVAHAPAVPPIDFTGMSAIVAALAAHVDTHDMMLGIATFDRAVPPFALPAWLWTGPLVLARVLAAVLAVVPLLLAVPLFHRFSPDRVKPGRARARRAPLALLNGWLRPLARLAQPLFGLAARLPGIAGQTLADVALTLAAAPAALALLLAAQAAALAVDVARLPALALAAVACWGILASDLSTRDGDCACAGLGAAVPGGAARRYWRQLLAALVLGLMFTGVAALRLAVHDPLRAWALLAGLFALAALATLLGRASGSARTFLALFLFCLYVSVNASDVAALDLVGFHGTATRVSVLGWLAAGLAAAWTGHAWNLRRAAAGE